MDKVEDVIELLESVKNWTDPVSDEHPFGTVDYMQIDSAIEFLRGLTPRALDGDYCACESKGSEYHDGQGWVCTHCRRPRQ